MRRQFAVAVGVLFGLLPATYLLFWAVSFGVALLVLAIGPPAELSEIDVAAHRWRLMLMLLAPLAAVAGYVALLSAVRGVTSRRVAIGLALGIAANVYAIVLMWDLDSYAMRQWSTWYWFASPIIVAAGHLVANLIRAGGGDTSRSR
jgi:hypothetical protein